MNSTSRTLTRIGALLLAVGIGGCSSPPVHEMPTVDQVDLARYTGAWFEIALVPNRFQAVCVADTQAQYRADGDVIRVRNRCRRADGEIEEANGIAKPVAGSGNAKLRVSFFRPFYGDYWVLALEPDYRWVLVGEPSRRFGWILSRTPTLDEATRNRILDQAEALGYARSDFQLSPQTRPLD